MPKFLTLNLDELFKKSNYYYTDFDVGMTNNTITIYATNKEDFLDQFAAEWREMAEDALEESDVIRDSYGEEYPEEPGYEE